MTKTREEVFAELDGIYEYGGTCDGENISDTMLLAVHVVRRYQYDALCLARDNGLDVSAASGGVLMGECLGMWNGDKDFDKLPESLRYLRYTHEWATEKQESLLHGCL